MPRFRALSAAVVLAVIYGTAALATWGCVGMAWILCVDLVRYCLTGAYEFDKGDGAALPVYLTVTSLAGIQIWFWIGRPGWSQKAACLLFIPCLAGILIMRPVGNMNPTARDHQEYWSLQSGVVLFHAALIWTRTRLLKRRWPYLEVMGTHPENAKGA